MRMRYYGWMLVLLVGLPLQAGVGTQLRQAGKLYANEQYGQALSSYEKALQQDPHNAQAAFGAGAAAYKLKEYQQAQAAFESVSHEDSQLGQDALFNLGNTFYRAGQQDPAIAAYRQAILKNPQDKEAIHWFCNKNKIKITKTTKITRTRITILKIRTSKSNKIIRGRLRNSRTNKTKTNNPNSRKTNKINWINKRRTA